MNMSTITNYTIADGNANKAANVIAGSNSKRNSFNGAKKNRRRKFLNSKI